VSHRHTSERPILGVYKQFSGAVGKTNCASGRA
jgi:hypothetical protein